jgi:hypothetical protein
LPLRMELAMTFKAIFPDILARDRSGQASFGPAKRFRLQHNDFVGLCQRFTGSRGRSLVSPNRLGSLWLFGFGEHGLDGLGVVVGEVGRY